MQSIINSVCGSLIEILPVFVIAVLTAALLDYFLPKDVFANVSKLNWQNLLIVTCFGALIPMCTCGMIPFAQKLYQRGVHWVLTLSFLVAGSACSVPALILTGVLGYQLVIARFVGSMLLGMVTALIAYQLSSRIQDYPIQINPSHSCCDHRVWYQVIAHDIAEMSRAFLPWIFFAALVSGLLDHYSSGLTLDSHLGVYVLPCIASLIAFPFYFCAGADLPLTQTFAAMNLGFGTILSFMLAAPTLNLTSLLVYRRLIGSRASFVLFAILFLLSSGFGILLNCIKHG